MPTYHMSTRLGSVARKGRKGHLYRIDPVPHGPSAEEQVRIMKRRVQKAERDERMDITLAITPPKTHVLSPFSLHIRSHFASVGWVALPVHEIFELVTGSPVVPTSRNKKSTSPHTSPHTNLTLFFCSNPDIESGMASDVLIRGII